MGTGHRRETEELQPYESFLQQPYESFLQLAARNCNPAKASCSLQRGIAALRKLPAACSEELQPYESFLQLAAGNRNVRKLPAACSGKSQRAKLPKVIVN